MSLRCLGSLNLVARTPLCTLHYPYTIHLLYIEVCGHVLGRLHVPRVTIGGLTPFNTNNLL